MTDDEYRQFLAALARKHVQARWRRHLGPDGGEYLRYEIDRIGSTARLVKVASERVGEQALIEIVAKEIKHSYVSQVAHAMEEAGVLRALEEAPDLVFGELRRSAIPDEDVDLLRLAGVEEPEAEITVVIHYARGKGRQTRYAAVAYRQECERRAPRGGRDARAAGGQFQ